MTSPIQNTLYECFHGSVDAFPFKPFALWRHIIAFYNGQ